MLRSSFTGGGLTTEKEDLPLARTGVSSGVAAVALSSSMLNGRSSPASLGAIAGLELGDGRSSGSGRILRFKGDEARRSRLPTRSLLLMKRSSSSTSLDRKRIESIRRCRATSICSTSSGCTESKSACARPLRAKGINASWFCCTTSSSSVSSSSSSSSSNLGGSRE